MTPVCSCGKPIADQATVCATCRWKLEKALAEVPALVSELETARLKQSRMGGRSIGVVASSHEQPLPFDARAAEVADHLRAILVGWTRVVCEERGVGMPDDDLTDISRFLLRHVDWLVHHPAAADVVSEVVDAVGPCWAVIDAPADRQYVGVCSADLGAVRCGRDLYVRKGKTTVTCPLCGYVHDVRQRRAFLLRSAEDVVLTLRAAADAMTGLNRPVTVRSLIHLTERKHRPLLRVGSTPTGVATYRLGDIMDLWAEKAAS